MGTKTNNSKAVHDGTAKYVRGLINQAQDVAKKEDKSLNLGVLDSMVSNGTVNMDNGEAPEAVLALLDGMGSQVCYVEGGRTLSPTAAVLDAIAKGERYYEEQHGSKAPSYVLDSAIRSALPMVSANARKVMGISGQYDAVLDNLSSTSSGAMTVGQIMTGIYKTYAEAMPFGGRVSIGEGLKTDIFLLNNRTVAALGGYGANARLDGQHSGRPFLMALRDAESTSNVANSVTTYTGVIKLSDGDAAGSAIVPSTVQVKVDGLVAAYTNPELPRSTANVSLGGGAEFVHPATGTPHTISGTVDVLNGTIVAVFTPELPANAVVSFTAALDFEHATLKDKRGRIEAHAPKQTIRATHSSGYYLETMESSAQWQADIRMDGASMALTGLRDQHAAESLYLAIGRMFAIGSAYPITFDMNSAARLQDRSYASIFRDLAVPLEAANAAMMTRTNQSAIGVIYTGEAGRAHFAGCGLDIWQPSGLRPRASGYRLGKLFGLYDVYYHPHPKLRAAQNGDYPLLCIGTSDAAACQPYITGTGVGTVLSTIHANTAGENGQFYFGVGTDTVNPFPEVACAAAVITVKQ